MSSIGSMPVVGQYPSLQDLALPNAPGKRWEKLPETDQVIRDGSSPYVLAGANALGHLANSGGFAKGIQKPMEYQMSQKALSLWGDCYLNPMIERKLAEKAFHTSSLPFQPETAGILGDRLMQFKRFLEQETDKYDKYKLSNLLGIRKDTIKDLSAIQERIEFEGKGFRLTDINRENWKQAVRQNFNNAQLNYQEYKATLMKEGKLFSKENARLTGQGVKNYLRYGMVGTHLEKIANFIRTKANPVAAGFSGLNLAVVGYTTYDIMRQTYKQSLENDEKPATRWFKTVKAGAKQLFKTAIAFEVGGVVMAATAALVPIPGVNIFVGLAAAVAVGYYVNKGIDKVIGKPFIPEDKAIHQAASYITVNA